MRNNKEFHGKIGKQHYRDIMNMGSFLLMGIVILMVSPPVSHKLIILFMIFAFFWHLFRRKFVYNPNNEKIAFNYDKHFLILNKRHFSFSDIEQYWTTKKFSPYFTERIFPIQTTMLYFKVKNRFFPYYFDLGHNFSQEDSKNILNCLKQTKIKNKKGNDREFYLFLLIMVSVLISLITILTIYRILS